MAVALLYIAACSTTKSIDTPTQVLLRVSCDDEELLRRTTSVQVSVSSWEQGAFQDVPPLSIDVRRIEWPLEIPIFPRKGSDESRLFQVVVQALDGRQLLAETRAVARFSRGLHKRLDRELYFCPNQDPGYICSSNDCQGEDCLVCTKQGECEPVGVLEELPDDGPNEGGIDHGEDSGSELDAETRPDVDGSTSDLDADSNTADASFDAAALDANTESGLPTDAADTGVPDAGLGPCTPASLTRCGQVCVNLDSSAMNCGRCDRTCRSNACNAGACAATSVYTHTPASADAGTSLRSLAIDPPFLYFEDPASPVIQRVTTSGSAPSLVSYSAPEGIAVLRIDNGYLYSASVPSNGGTAIHRMALSSDQFVLVAGAQLSTYVINMTTNTNQVLISSTLSRYYIQAIPKTGGSSFALLASGPSISGEFEADDSNIFIRDDVAISRSSAVTEGTPAAIATFENGEVCRDMILIGDQLAFGTSQRIAIVPKAGGAVTTLATLSAALLAADAEYLYVIHGLGSECSGGTEIYRIPLTGGAPVRLASEATSCRDTSCCGGPLMQDSSALYWLRGDRLAIRRVEK